MDTSPPLNHLQHPNTAPLQTRVKLHVHSPADDELPLAALLDGLDPDELVTLGLLKGVSRHDALGLKSSRPTESIRVSAKTAGLVERFAQKHGTTLVAAADLLFWSGLNYRHGKDLAKLPVVAKAPTLPDETKPETKTKGRPKSGQGQRAPIRLTTELESRLLDYGAKYGNLLRKWMKQYADNPVPFVDCSNFQLESGRTDRPVMAVSLLPWQVELLGEIESAFGCSRSQALMKILVAIGVAQA
jgi:hypothetical protein